MHFLLFSAHFDRDKGLDMGRLSLNHIYDGTVNIWISSSSVSGKQYPESFHRRGGFLPPQYRTSNVKTYSVKTQPIDLSGTRGVKGNFYQILPFEIFTDKGGVRSDFGIHKDADAPGSLGCIVMNADRFKEFEAEMFILLQKNIFSVPLFVQYS